MGEIIMNSLSFDCIDVIQNINSYLTPKEIKKNSRVNKIFNSSLSSDTMKEIVIKSQFRQPLTEIEFKQIKAQPFSRLEDLLVQSRIYASVKEPTLSRSKFSLPLIFSPNPNKQLLFNLVDKIYVNMESNTDCRDDPWALGDDHFIVPTTDGSDDCCFLNLIRYDTVTGKMLLRDQLRFEGFYNPCLLNDGFIAVGVAVDKLSLFKADTNLGKLSCCSKIEFKLVGTPCPLNKDFFVMGSRDNKLNIVNFDKDTGTMTLVDSLYVEGLVHNSTYLGHGLLACGTDGGFIYTLHFDEKTGKIISSDECNIGGSIKFSPCSINDDTFIINNHKLFSVNFDVRTGKILRTVDCNLDIYSSLLCKNLGNNLIACNKNSNDSKSFHVLRYDPQSGILNETYKSVESGYQSPLSILRYGLVSFTTCDNELNIHLVHIDMESGKVVEKQKSSLRHNYNIFSHSSPCTLSNDYFVVGTIDGNFQMYKIEPKNEPEKGAL